MPSALLRTLARKPIVPALVSAAAAVLLTAACGGSGGSSNTSSNGNGQGGQRQAELAAYVECLKQNGVTVTLPTGNASGRPRGSGFPTNRPTDFPSGMPNGGFPSGGASGGPGGGGFRGGGGFGAGAIQKPDGVDDATWEKAREACASKLPTAGPGGGNGNRDNGQLAAYRNCLQSHGVTLTNGQQLNTTDPKVAAAEKACAPLRPSGRPSASPTA